MSKTLYFDCFSGCSGDMILGALLDMGVPLAALEEGLGSLAVSGYRLEVEKVKRSSVTASKLRVILDDSQAQPARSLAEILQMIDASRLSAAVREKSKSIFSKLGECEAEVHGVPLEKVHFHEIGAVDSIVDIVGAVLGFEMLEVERFFSSPLPVGNGTVKTAHGVLPVPAPATLKLLAQARAPLAPPPVAGETSGELVTPTGAAIITSLASFSLPSMVIEKVGCGAGSKDFAGWPNVLRLWLGQEAKAPDADRMVLLETNIDNMNHEICGYLMEKLFAQGAADVWFTPVYMKKNRPAIMLSVLAPGQAEGLLTETIFKETPTLGIRVRPVARHIVEREAIEFDSTLGRAAAKVKRFKGRVIGVAPEYDHCRRIALEKDVPLQEVYRILSEEARRSLKAPQKKG